MRVNLPTRIEPLPESQWTDEQRQMAAPLEAQYGLVFNVLKTLMRHMPLLKSWNPLAGYLMTGSSLSPRHRELLIMRVAWQTGSDYEWGQHVLMSQAAGLSEQDHRRIKAGPDDPGWPAIERALLKAADELLDEQYVSEPTWESLTEQLTDVQRMDAIFTVGQYAMLAMALKTLGVEREPGVPGFDGG